MKNTKSAFTLIEIMTVVVIIGLLTAMAVPAFHKVRERSLERYHEQQRIEQTQQSGKTELPINEVEAMRQAYNADFCEIRTIDGEKYWFLIIKGEQKTFKYTKK